MNVKDYFDDVGRVADEFKKQYTKILLVIEKLKEAKNKGQTVFFCGNGGSAGTSVHMAADLFKIGGVRAISLTENSSLTSAIINDEGWEHLFTFQLKQLFKKGDILIAFSVHGGSGEDKAGAWSQNLLSAIEYVNKNGGTTIGFSGFDGGAMKKMCTISVVVPASTTPLVESFHVVLEHLISFSLSEGDRV